MEQLDLLRSSDPEKFKQSMEAMGITMPNGETANAASSSEDIVRAVMQMRSEASGNDIPSDIKISTGNQQQPKGIHITPTPAFAYKTRRLKDNMKVFINITDHEQVDEPAIKKKLNEEGEEVEGMNIPMSVGPPRLDQDKKGSPCTVYDIIVNPIVTKECKDDVTGKYREFICQLGIQYLEQKYKDDLDKRYKLPKLNYMGKNVESQYIKDKKNMPTIEEVSSKPSNSNKSKQKKVEEVANITEVDLPYSINWLIDPYLDSNDTLITELNELYNINTITENKTLKKILYQHDVATYIDPIVDPPSKSKALILSAGLKGLNNSIPDIQISTSPFKLFVKLYGYKPLTVYLPTAILPSQCSYCVLDPWEDGNSSLELRIVLPLDPRDISECGPDVGSKAWLMSNALTEENINPYDLRQKTESYQIGDDIKPEDSNEFAEDKFHIKLPDGVDQYTGIPMDGEDLHANKKDILDDDVELPEDRFHKKDASSSYYINQREKAKQDKWDKYNKEKEERVEDPNVEYIDVDDFKPGGKYGGSKQVDKAAEQLNVEQSEQYRKAAEVLASTAEKIQLDTVPSSTLWTELLD